jgi:hypothetical protein
MLEMSLRAHSVRLTSVRNRRLMFALPLFP